MKAKASQPSFSQVPSGSSAGARVVTAPHRQSAVKHPTKMLVERILVTPTWAADALARTDPNNRAIQARYVERMALEMTKGQWLESHQGIAFSADGTLKDGQHRLSAIIKSGVSVYLWVFRHLPAESMLVVDSGKQRSIADAMTITGTPMDRNRVAVGRAMMISVDKQYYNPSRDELIRFLEYHSAPLDFVLHQYDKRTRITHACVRAPIARAWYTQDHNRLMQFMECLRTGIVSSNADQAAGALYRFIYSSPGIIQGGKSLRASLYAKTCCALRAFVKRKAIKQVFEVQSDPFPIPDVEEASA